MNAVVRFTLWLSLVVSVALLVARPARAADPPSRVGRRVAIVVGANEPAPGRQALRYSHDDARMLADTLVQVGHFSRTDVRVLLEPRPGDVLTALDTASRELAALPGDSLLLFYYSGHSDGQHVYPHGEKLPLTDLRERLGRSSARVRIAIVDTCRGGSWTRAKGLTVGPPLDPIDLMNVATEGTALLSSSSGMESAHEAGSIKGSFFTHHLNAGLLGAADTSGDGNVTLQEAFVYARERTVRDSARMAATTQHPSFDMQLRGRQDIVLAQTKSSKSALAITQKNTLEIIHLGSGATVAETPPGALQIRLALPPGRYVVRRVENGRVHSKELVIAADAVVMLDEAQLEDSSDKLALKSTDDSEAGEGEEGAGEAKPVPVAAKPAGPSASDEKCCCKECKPCKEACTCKKGKHAKHKKRAKKHAMDVDERELREALEDLECEDDEEMWEKTTVFGVRGALTHVDGAENDGTYAGAMVSVASEQYKSWNLASAHFAMNMGLGGGSAGLEGALGGSITGGIRIPVTANQGPIARMGVGGEMLGNRKFYFSRITLPVAEIGYQYSLDRTVLELGARGDVILTGRYNSDHRTRRELGVGTLEWGGYLAAHTRFGRLDVSYSRIEGRDTTPRGVVSVLRGTACGHILDKIGVCLDGMLLDGLATYPAPEGAPVVMRPTPNVTSFYGGLTVGIIEF